MGTKSLMLVCGGVGFICTYNSNTQRLLYICQAPTWVHIFRDSPGLTLIPTDFERFLTKKSTGSSAIKQGDFKDSQDISIDTK